jgi:hypothetical protein
MAPKQKVRKVVSSAVKAVVIAAAAGMAVRAAQGGISGEEHIGRKIIHETRQHEMTPPEKEILSTTPEEHIERQIAALVEGSDKSRVEDLVAKYEGALARFEAEKTSGRVSESTFNDLTTLPEQIRVEIGLSEGKLDELMRRVDGNIHARAMRRSEVTGVSEKDRVLMPSLGRRIANILFAWPSTITHVHEKRVDVSVPDTLPTIEQRIHVSEITSRSDELTADGGKIRPLTSELADHSEETHEEEDETAPKKKDKKGGA